MCCIRLFTCNVYICKLCLNVVLFSMVYMLAWDIVLWIFTNWICQQTCLTNCFAHGMIISADLIFKWKRWAEVSCGMWSQRVPWYCSDIFGATGVRMLNDAIEVPWEVLWSFRLDEYSEEEDADPRPRRSSRVFWFEHCYTDVWTHSKGFSRNDEMSSDRSPHETLQEVGKRWARSNYEGLGTELPGLRAWRRPKAKRTPKDEQFPTN